ncbi:hypothetical protein OY671_009798, partial [Metschnikowia pulcherrima]
RGGGDHRWPPAVGGSARSVPPRQQLRRSGRPPRRNPGAGTRPRSGVALDRPDGSVVRGARRDHRLPSRRPVAPVRSGTAAAGDRFQPAGRKQPVPNGLPVDRHGAGAGHRRDRRGHVAGQRCRAGAADRGSGQLRRRRAADALRTVPHGRARAAARRGPAAAGVRHKLRTDSPPPVHAATPAGARHPGVLSPR